jgi:hypothetical protein
LSGHPIHVRHHELPLETTFVVLYATKKLF